MIAKKNAAVEVVRKVRDLRQKNFIDIVKNIRKKSSLQKKWVEVKSPPGSQELTMEV